MIRTTARNAAAALLLGCAAVADGGVRATGIPELLWSEIYAPGPANTAYDVAVDDLGNTYVITDQSLFAGCHLIKYDLWKQFKWEETYGSSNDFCKRVVIGPGGYIYVGGHNSADFRIMRYSPGKALNWSHLWGGPGQDTLHDMVATLDGGVVAVGVLENPTAGDLSDGGIVKRRFDGSLAIQYAYTPGNASFVAVAVSAFGIVAVGEVGSQALTVMLWPGGAVRWERPYGMNMMARAVDVDASGNVFVTGSDESGNVRTWKYDVDGTWQWDTPFPIAAGYVGRDIAVTAGGNAYVVASRDSGPSKVFIIRYDGTYGFELNSQGYDLGGADEYAHEVRTDGAGKVWVGIEIDDAQTFIDRLAVVAYYSNLTQFWSNIRPDSSPAGIDLYGGYPHLAASAKSSSTEQSNVLTAKYGKWKLDGAGIDKIQQQAPPWFLAGPGPGPGNGNRNFYDDDADFTTFHAHAGQSYDISIAASGPLLDGVALTLLDPGGSPLAAAGSVAGDTFLRWTAPQAGTIHLRFEPENRMTGDETEYGVMLSGNMGVSSLFSRTIGNGIPERGHGLVQLQDGGIAVAGEVAGDLLVAKAGVLGDPLWTRSYAGTDGTTTARAILRTRNGRLALAGETANTGAPTDALIVEIDPASGDVLDAWTLPGDDDDALTAIAAEPLQPSAPDDTTDQGYVAAGYTASYGRGGRDGLVVRIVDDGSPAWITAFGTGLDERVEAIALTPDEGLLAVGQVESPVEAFVARLDLDGAVLWSRSFGAPGYAWGADAVAALPDGGFVVTGYGPSPLGLPDDDLWVARFDGLGRVRWQRMLADEGDQRGLGVAELASGQFAVVGFTGRNRVDRDGWLLLFDRDGAVVSQSSIGGPGDDELHSVRPREGWGFAAAGTRAGGGASTAWLLVFDMEGTLAAGCALVGATTAQVFDAGPESRDAGFVGTPVAAQPMPFAVVPGAPRDDGVNECALLEPSEVSPPGSAQPLRFASDVDLEWDPAPGADSYDLYRGDVADLPMGLFGGAIHAGIVAARDTDDEEPAFNRAWIYTVRGVNRLGAGPGGTDFSGAPRGYPPDPLSPPASLTGIRRETARMADRRGIQATRASGGRGARSQVVRWTQVCRLQSRARRRGGGGWAPGDGRRGNLSGGS